jgi:hypothetical protein
MVYELSLWSRAGPKIGGYARVPPFVPVPVRARADGWTVERQGRFIGFLAETGSVAEAARRVGVSRVAAYQLRARFGAESFAHAWDRALALRAAARGEGVTVPRRKITPLEQCVAGMEGAITVTMRRGRFVRSERKLCVISLIRHVNRLDSRARRYGWHWSAAFDEEAAR